MVPAEWRKLYTETSIALIFFLARFREAGEKCDESGPKKNLESKILPVLPNSSFYSHKIEEITRQERKERELIVVFSY